MDVDIMEVIKGYEEIVKGLVIQNAALRKQLADVRVETVPVEDSGA